MRRLAAFPVALIALAACGDDGPSRQEVMGAVAAESAVPAYERFAGASGEVEDAIDAACAQPERGVVAIEEVDGARRLWLEVQALWLGPAMERRSTGLVDWPADPAGIDALVEGSNELTPEYVAQQVGSDVRGLRALRSVLARRDAADLLADVRWCEYLASVATVVADEGRALRDEWASFDDRVAGDDANDWLAMLVNDSLQTVKATTTTAPEVSDGSIAGVQFDRAAQLVGVRSAMTELGPLLGAELDAQLQDVLGDAIDAYQTGDVERGRTLATEAERLITADVAGKLGVSIGFSDADGDGSG